MMSGLRSHCEKIITCVSERSGRASSGMLRMLQYENASATATAASTRYLFPAENRMMDLIIASLPVSSVGFWRRRLAGGRRGLLLRGLRQRGQRGLETRLGVDEEVRPRHHLF